MITARVIGGNEDSQKLILQANIPFVELFPRARFTAMRDPSEDPYSEEDELPKNEFYQRRVDENRVNEIQRFIRNSILNEKNNKQVSVIFPTAMLLATNSDEYLRMGKEYDLEYVINSSEEIYVVDGQHRLFSMMTLYKSLQAPALFDDEESVFIRNYLEHYLFNCTIFMNFDLWEQAQIFADVNFNQKKVSTSIYYSIYGMNYSKNPDDLKRNHIFIAHKLVEFMNTYPESPLNGAIKMLGRTRGYISQSFLADALIKNIKSPRGIWYFDPARTEGIPSYKYMSVELLSFFTVVKDSFSQVWPVNGQHRSIICKTNGIGALLRYMVYLHREKMPRELAEILRKSSKTEVSEEYLSFAQKYLFRLKRYQEKLFGLSSEFAGSGGKGLEARLFNRMKDLSKYDMLEIKTFTINQIPFEVKYLRNDDGFYTYTLSRYYRTPDLLEPIAPDGVQLFDSLEEMEDSLRHYFEQIGPEATIVDNPKYY